MENAREQARRRSVFHLHPPPSSLPFDLARKHGRSSSQVSKLAKQAVASEQRADELEVAARAAAAAHAAALEEQRAGREAEIQRAEAAQAWVKVGAERTAGELLDAQASVKVRSLATLLLSTCQLHEPRGLVPHPALPRPPRP